jgi:hypothetical protein
MAMARMRRACLGSTVRAASARNCEILRSWCVISIAEMLPALRINDMLHRVTFAAVWESPKESASQAVGMRPAWNLRVKVNYADDVLAAISRRERLSSMRQFHDHTRIE